MYDFITNQEKAKNIINKYLRSEREKIKVDKSRVNNNKLYLTKGEKMKKLYLASIILTVSISLVGCTNSGVSNNGNQNNTTPSTQNSNESEVQNNNESSMQNNSTSSTQDSNESKVQNSSESSKQNNTTSSTQNNNESKVQNNNESSKQNNNVNNTGNISPDKAKEIALSHAGLTSSQVTFKRTELEYDDGIQKYDVEFYYNNREYSYEIDAKNGSILQYEQD